MYAFIVKNDEGTWDIWNHIHKIPDPVREERLANAVASGLPIVGQVLTPYQETVSSGAVWDGKKFTGGTPRSMPVGGWETITSYGYVCDNTILIIFYSQPGTNQDDKYQAIFDGETTIVKLPDGQTAEVGDIWDGNEVVSV